MEYAKHTGRMGMRNTNGSGEDIIQMEGRIVRSVGRKDRHSKVFTAKGPRDRRVRLSAHTAIQFYDVQDRLGYDRPSKAVDWLIKKAKSAIDKLAQLPPPYLPNASTDHREEEDPINASTQQHESGMEMEEPETPGYNNNFDTYAAIEDTMKSFFPITSSTTTNHCINNFQNYASQTEDLGLSLHSFPDQQALFTGSTSSPPQVGFHEANNYNQGTMAMAAAAWNRERAREHEEEEEEEGGGFVFHNSQPLLDSFRPTMRGPLQSNFAPANSSASTFFTWNDLSIASEKNQRISSTSHDSLIHQSSIFETRFGTDGFLGFNIPARIGEDHENGIVSDRPSSSSSLNSHH